MSDRRVLNFYRTFPWDFEKKHVFGQNPLPDNYRKALDPYMNIVCSGPLKMNDAITLMKEGMHGLEGKLWDNRNKASLDVEVDGTTYAVLDYRRVK